jgi:integrase/recombinase XerD
MGMIRDRMVAELDLRGLAEATKTSYLMCCRQFVAHYMRSPEQLGAAETKAFILHLIQERKVSPSSVGVYVAAVRFLYRVVLRNPQAVEDLPRPKIPIRLPPVPSREEVGQLLDAVRSVKYRAILTVAYGAGLRISEVCRLRVTDLDSKQMMLHVRAAKGGKDRLVPMSPRMLRVLRAYWVETRQSGPLLFPGRLPGRTIRKDTVRKVLKRAVAEVGIKKRVTLHSLRHGFATHLLEDGEDIRVLQALLGHSHVQTTAHYARVTTRRLKKVRSPVDRLAQSKDATTR